MRATWSETDPAQIDTAADLFKQQTLSRIEDLPGFCSASLLVNRSDGRAVVTVGYDSREALDLSRMPADAVRDEAAREGNLQVVEVRRV